MTTPKPCTDGHRYQDTSATETHLHLRCRVCHATKVLRVNGKPDAAALSKLYEKINAPGGAATPEPA